MRTALTMAVTVFVVVFFTVYFFARSLTVTITCPQGTTITSQAVSDGVSYECITPKDHG